MYVVLVLLIASALLGLATGFSFRVWANLLASPFVAVVSMIILRYYGFNFLPCVAIAISCLFISQLAYCFGAFLSVGEETNLLARDAINHEPAITPSATCTRVQSATIAASSKT